MSDNKMRRTRRKAPPTTHVRVREVDLPLLDEICDKLQEMNNGMFFSHADAISVLVRLAKQTEYFISTTME